MTDLRERLKSRIEAKYGYDVIDDKNYTDQFIEPTAQEKMNATNLTNIALIPVLAKVQELILTVEYFKLTGPLAHALSALF